jgi:hypothetical protein
MGADVLGVTFADVRPADVNVISLTGVPPIDVTRIANAIHSKYDMVQHAYTQGPNKVNLYDGNRDASLVPVNAAVPPDIGVSDFTAGDGTEYLRVVLPIWVHAEQGPYTYDSFGHATFNRKIVRTDTTITIDMSAEPMDATLHTVVTLDNAGPGHDLVITVLTPQIVAALDAFGTITEPAFTDAAARSLLASQTAGYIVGLRFPCYSPQSPDPTIMVTTPVGFLLPANGVMAIMLTRRSGTAADDVAPDDFLGGDQLALASSPDFVMERINQAIHQKYPHLDNGGDEITTDQGSATLKHLTAELADPGDHGQAAGHIWTTGDADVHIKCWPDPSVSFEGPIFIDVTNPPNPDGSCGLVLQPRAGDFDIDESCCSVFIDILIPIVGWIMLGIVESTINSVGGQLIGQVAGSETQSIAPIPPVVNGIAQVDACLTTLNISRQGFVFPGTISVRRLTRSFGDMQAGHHQPSPNGP